MNNYTITFEPGNHKILAPEGSSIKEALTSAALDFDFPCGGRGTCGKCRIKVLEKNMVGNAAGTGAKLALLSRSEYEHSNNIAASVKYIELAAQQSFNKAFAKGLEF